MTCTIDSTKLLKPNAQRRRGHLATEEIIRSYQEQARLVGTAIPAWRTRIGLHGSQGDSVNPEDAALCVQPGHAPHSIPTIWHGILLSLLALDAPRDGLKFV